MLMIDCANGIAGNMVVGSLISLGADQQAIKEIMESTASELANTKVNIKDVKRNGVISKFVEVKTEQTGHTTYSELLDVIKNSGIREKKFAISILETIGKAESRVHNTCLEELHLHELGSADLVADIVGVAEGLSTLGLFSQKLYSTPVSLGKGYITFSHGRFPIPPPATKEIIERHTIPFALGPVEGELTTPTGIAILANLYPRFSNVNSIPKRIGYGAGSEKKGIPNILKLILSDDDGNC